MNYKRFVRVKMDITTDSNYGLVRPLFAAGIESYMNDWFILRWGAQRDNEKATNKYTAGLGFIGPKFAFHYAYQNSPEDLSLIDTQLTWLFRFGSYFALHNTAG